jgi:hypothetical protein
MKSRTLMCITAMTLFAALALPVQLAAQITGGGTTNFIPKWTGSTKLGNSKLFQVNGQVGIGTTKPAATVDVIGQSATNTLAAAPTALRVSGGTGGNGGLGAVRGTGGGILLMSGPGGKGICLLLSCSPGGAGGSLTIGGGNGGSGSGSKSGGPGGHILVQPGAGGSGVANGRPGNVLLAPSSGNVGIGTTSPTAKLYVQGNFVATGTKSALVETASYGKRQLYAIESPENWFEDFGGGSSFTVALLSISIRSLQKP